MGSVSAAGPCSNVHASAQRNQSLAERKRLPLCLVGEVHQCAIDVL